jgi:hypothetical protein
MRKRIKKYSHTWWHNRLDPKLSEIVIEKKICAKCRKRNLQFNCSHIKPKGRYQGLRYDPVNVLCLCARCHAWFWHDDPLEATEWFRAKYPNRYVYLQEAKKIFVKRNQEYYKKVDKALNERDFKNLYVLSFDKCKEK